jgi:2-(1,2-epoxy-1,2-dihydrophenyl)acetyl-CoA isomerase
LSDDILRSERDGGVAFLTLNRPDAANAIDLPLGRALCEEAIRLDEDPSVRAVVVAGAGRMFCAGGDLRAFADAGERLPALLKELTTYLHAALSRLARMRAPVIASVQGPAAGAGMSLACACDLVLASEKASFTMAYTRAGLTPDGSSTWVLPRVLGARRTLELMLTNRTLTAAEAAAWGLVNRVAAPEALEEETRALARSLAEGATGAFGATKKLVLLSASQGFEAQMELESRAIADAARSPDGREGIAAFLAKRSPKFTGA